MSRLPLFPLDAVLFPGMLLPIHVFEKRYLRMVADCQAKDSPFGVVLGRHPRHWTGPASYRIGTAAHIIQSEEGDDGTLDIVVVGRDRFKVREVAKTRSYHVAQTEPYPLLGVEDSDVSALAERVRAGLFAYTDLLGRASGTVIQVDELPDEPDVLAWVVGVALQVSLREQEKLLECGDLPSLFKRELAILSLEKQLLTYIESTQEERGDWELAPFVNWSPN